MKELRPKDGDELVPGHRSDKWLNLSTLQAPSTRAHCQLTSHSLWPHGISQHEGYFAAPLKQWWQIGFASCASF